MICQVALLLNYHEDILWQKTILLTIIGDGKKDVIKFHSFS